MNFLAPFKDFAKGFESQAKQNVAITNVPHKIVQNKQQGEKFPSPKTESINQPHSPWIAPKRVKRLRHLADEGSFGNSIIEGLQINGAWAEAFIRAYDRGNNHTKHCLATQPISEIFQVVEKWRKQGIL